MLSNMTMSSNITKVWSLSRIGRNHSIHQSFMVCRCKSTATVTMATVFSSDNKERVKNRLTSVHPVRELPTKSSKLVKAAVLVPLCTIQGKPSLLFTLRSSKISSHRGEVSFPGGKMDKTDKDLAHTALREAHEEIGLDMHSVDIWGEMNPIPNRTDSMKITPVLGNCGELDMRKLTPNTLEVAEVFHRTIESLCAPENNHYTRFRSSIGYTLPVFTGGEHRIWGLTAIVLHQTLTIIAPGLYKFKLRHIS